MRKKRTLQASIFEYYSQHESGQQLQVISAQLDTLPQILNLAAQDLGVVDCGFCRK